MLERVLRNHTVLAPDGEGGFCSVRRTCADIQATHTPHYAIRTVDDGSGGTKKADVIVTCADAEVERQRLLVDTSTQRETISRQVTQLSALELDVANYKRLVAGAMKIVFRMGPVLQRLLAEDLTDPCLTDDGSVVKVENPLFTVLIDPFGERITIRTHNNVVDDRVFPVVDGRMSEDDQTLLLGHIDRIRKAAGDGGADPVAGAIDVLQAAASTKAGHNLVS